LTFGATGTTNTAKLYENGYVTAYVMTVANFTNVVTATLSIQDDDGDTIYTGSAHAKGATHLVASLNIPVDRNYTATITLSGDAGGSGGNVVLKLFTEFRK
jgi:hypothetical protein